MRSSNWNTKPYKAVVFLLFGLALPSPAKAAFCENWSKAKEVGELDTKRINESSGLVVSRVFESRLYHTNDSGAEGKLYITDLDGKNTKEFRIKGFDPLDAEDLAQGPCLEENTEEDRCLYIADIGDNKQKRKTIKVVLVKEVEDFGEEVEPLREIELKYPDGKAHNAEGFAVHPNGDLYILTKEIPAQLFKLAQGENELRLITKISFSALSLVTGLDISPEGGKFLALTYTNAFEFALTDDESDLEIKDIDIKVLPQQEAISYGLTDRSFYYTTEKRKKNQRAPILRVDCLDETDS